MPCYMRIDTILIQTYDFIESCTMKRAKLNTNFFFQNHQKIKVKLQQTSLQSGAESQKFVSKVGATKSSLKRT